MNASLVGACRTLEAEGLGQWMDRMAPEWIRARLEASGLVGPIAADAAGAGVDAAQP